MRIETLKEFVCLAETLYYRGAARKCFISQSSLSKHIDSLEKELGFKLFVRDNQQVVLTSAGEVFLTGARKILDDYRACLESVERFRTDRAFLRIGYLYGASHEFLAALSEAFLAKNSDVQVRFYRGQGEALAECLEDGSVDIVLDMDLANYPSPLYEKLPLYQDGYGALLPKGHKLATRATLAMDDLAGEVLLLPSRAYYGSSWKFLSKALEESLGKAVDARDILNDPMELPFHVSTTGGIGLMAQHALNMIDAHGLVCIPIDDERLQFDVSLVWRKDKEKDSLVQLIALAREIAPSAN